MTSCFFLVVENLATFTAKKSVDSKWEIIKPSEPVQEEREREDEQPQVVETSIQGGLQTASQVKAKFKAIHKPRVDQEVGEEEETIYRDAQGKKMDTKVMRAEEKRRKAKELDQQIAKMQWGKGLVQRQERIDHADELSRIAAQPFARSVSPYYFRSVLLQESYPFIYI